MNPRAFNLFTALIAFLLIGLTVLLLNSMTASERKQADTLAQMERESNLRAVADMARADAFQSFNYIMRARIEDFVTDSRYGATPLSFREPDGTPVSWDNVQLRYAEAQFGTSSSRCASGGSNCGAQFTNFLVSSLLNYFPTGLNFENYEIKLESNSADLEAAIEEIIQKTVDPASPVKFLEPVDCEEADCKLGTFYVNFRVTNLDPALYEKLPLVVVRDNATGEIVKVPLLARANYKIYVPIRLFKAIWLSRKLSGGDSTASGFNSTSRAILSPRVHNTIEALRLGFCDVDTCVPRTNPFASPTSNGLPTKLGLVGGNSACNAGIMETFPLNCQGAGDLASKLCQGTTKTNYNARDSQASGNGREEILSEMVRNGLWEIIRQNAGAPGGLFTPVNPSDPASALFASDSLELNLKNCAEQSTTIDQCLTVWTSSRPSKGVYTGGPTEPVIPLNWDATVVNDIADFATTPAAIDPCASPGAAGGTHVSPEPPPGQSSPDGTSIRGAESQPTAPSCTTPAVNPPDKTFYCTEVSRIELFLSFRETNNIYRVRDSRENIYNFKISDQFFPFNAGVRAGGPASPATCLLGDAQTQACALDPGQGWACKEIRYQPLGTSLSDLSECAPY